MNYRIVLGDVTVDGPFSIFTKLSTQAQFVVYETGISKESMIKGKIINISDLTAQIKIVNDSPCCGVEKFIYLSTIAPTPTPTPTMTATTIVVPSPTPTSIGTETTILQPWLTGLAMSTDVTSFDLSMFANRTEDIELKVVSLNGDYISGSGWQGVAWNSNTWVSGTAEYAAPYSEVFRLNPITPGNGGLIPGVTYKFLFRRTGNNSVVYTRNITIPIASQQATAIDLGPAPTPSVTSTPGVTPSISVTPTKLPASATPTPTPTKSIALNARRIYMNTTGYGFDLVDADGINGDWKPRINGFINLNHNGNIFTGINGVRLCVRWGDYEPTEGVFNDAKLIAAINYIKSRGLKFSVCFWALRTEGDSYIPTSDKATGANGQVYYYEINKYTIAPYSTAGKAKLKNAVKHLASVMSQYPNDTDYVSLAYGNTEEFFMPIIQSYPNGQQVNTSLTGYSPVDRSAWVTFAAANGVGGQNPPVSPDTSNAYITGSFWNGSAVGKAWYEFITQGLVSLHAAFRDGVREGGRKVCGFYADAGGAQSAWYMTHRLNRIFEGCDMIYSSEGEGIYDNNNKLMATDLNIGTFPNKEYAIEIDPIDIAVNPGSFTYGQPLDANLFRTYSESFFKRGGNVLHLALAFSPGDNGAPNNINTLAPVLYDLQTNYVQQANITRLVPANNITFTLTILEGDAGYRQLWKSGSNDRVNNQSLITLQG